MGNAYVLGGYVKHVILYSCLMFNPGDCSWKEVAEMKEKRYYALQYLKKKLLFPVDLTTGV